MPTGSVLSVIVGVSGFIGLLSLMAYLTFLFKVRQLERSVRQTIEGEGLFNASQIVRILEQFKDDHEGRLNAIRALAKVDSGKAEAILLKVKDNVDIGQLERISNTRYQWAAGMMAAVFLGLAVLGFLYSKLRDQAPEKPAPTVIEARWSLSMPLPDGWSGLSLNMPPLPNGRSGVMCQCANPTVLPVPNTTFQRGSIVEFPNHCTAAIEVAIGKVERSSAGFLPMVARTVLPPGSVLIADVSGAVGFSVLLKKCPA